MAATHTTNLNLNKPDRQDFVSVVNDINDNMDLIDTAVGNLDTDKVNISDIVDNLTTNDSMKPLSAAQGYALNSKIATTAITGCTVSSTDARFKSASSSVEKCYRTGNVVVLRIATRWDFSSSNFNVGDDVTMTVTGIPSPLVVVSAAAYHTSRLMVGSIDTDKTINVRNITSVNNNSNVPLSFTFVYVCND